MRSVSRTGFSREEAGLISLNFTVWNLTLSRLKPVPQKACSPSQCMQSHWLRAVIQWDRLQPGRCRLISLNLAVWHPALSRLKPVPQKHCSPSQCMQSHWLHAVIQWDRLQPGRGRFDQPQFRGLTPRLKHPKRSPSASLSRRCGWPWPGARLPWLRQSPFRWRRVRRAPESVPRLPGS